MVAVPPPRLNFGFSYCTVRNPDVWHSHCVVCITLILSKQRNRCFPTNMLEIKGQCADCVFIFVGDDLLYCASLQLPSQYLNSPPSKAQGSELSAIETFSARCRHKLYNLLYSSSFHRQSVLQVVDDLEREKETRADWSREGELLAAQVPNMLYLLKVLTY